jgi:hypothetical protein
MRNICHECIYHEKCMGYRYNNVQTRFMKKVYKEKNKDGNIIIFVEECNNFIKRKFKYVPMKLELKKIANEIKRGIDKSE